jgi:hypothetical protein
MALLLFQLIAHNGELDSGLNATRPGGRSAAKPRQTWQPKSRVQHLLQTRKLRLNAQIGYEEVMLSMSMIALPTGWSATERSARSISRRNIR